MLAMQTYRNQVAVVVDEHGASVGLVFLADALEEIVGPLSDEFDEDVTDFEELEEGGYRLSGGSRFPRRFASWASPICRTPSRRRLPAW